MEAFISDNYQDYGYNKNRSRKSHANHGSAQSNYNKQKINNQKGNLSKNYNLTQKLDNNFQKGYPSHQRPSGDRAQKKHYNINISKSEASHINGSHEKNATNYHKGTQKSNFVGYNSDYEQLNSLKELKGFKIVHNGSILHDLSGVDPNTGDQSPDSQGFSSAKFASSLLITGPSMSEISLPSFFHAE